MPTQQLIDIPRNWTFENQSIAQGFDRHVREQLPWYDLATGAIAHIGRHYIPRNGRVYDIGASTGNIGRCLQPVLDDRNATLIAIEASEDMASAYEGPGELIIADAMDVDYQPFDFAALFLVLMFLPVSARAGLIDKLKTALRPGGAIAILDKCQASSGYLSTVLWRLTLAGKVAAGVQPDEIVSKELSLSGVQRPLSRDEVPDAVQWFQFGEFAGWIIEG